MNNLKQLSLTVATGLLAIGLQAPFSFITQAQEADKRTDVISAQEIINKAELAAYYAGNDGKTQARMMIIDEQDRRQVRQFTILRKDVEDGGDQKMLVFFSRPADVSGMVFRVEKRNKISEDDDRWLYLPGLDLVKRISAGDKRTSFVGSHFFYEDVSGRSTKADTFELISQNDTRYILKATPKQPNEVEFNYYQIEIDKQTYLPMLIDFYDSNNNKYRSVETLETETISGHVTVTKSKITDLKAGGYTLMEFRNISYDIGLPDSIFTERSLKTPPVEWLRK
ncbi:outer membrane lipoprotein-sorting protein [Psychrosphaera aestuarii]|uniref:outer membrane lipoprotein-sorting protein n=1 Tax=Psychrosphaera aestuarii TaxID=1266052 RepID=UPI001B32ADEC|nr:outer membrane lipoprotein-sorting protein [Psychrosphaera aestuarii]